MRRNSVLIAAAFLFSSLGASAASPIAFKLGLWEVTMVSRTKGPPQAQNANKPGSQATGEASTITRQSCMTTEQQKDPLGLLNSFMQNCTFSKKEVTAKGMVLDAKCSFPGGATLALQSDAHFDSAKKVRATSHSVMTFPSGPMAGVTVTDMEVTGHFVKADCGAVKPAPPASPPQ